MNPGDTGSGADESQSGEATSHLRGGHWAAQLPLPLLMEVSSSWRSWEEKGRDRRAEGNLVIDSCQGLDKGFFPQGLVSLELGLLYGDIRRYD